jgi:hypothetical protein
MFYRFWADFVVLLHFGFVLFAILGGFLVIRWKKSAWVHLPTALWAILIEFGGWICPLTPLEKWLRQQGGELVYQTGFIEQYILPVLYPAALTRQLQIILGLFVLSVNIIIYGWLVYRIIKIKN